MLEYFDPDKACAVTVEDGQVIMGALPLLSGFAWKLGVTRDTLHTWANAKHSDGTLKHAEFSDAYARAKEAQEVILATGGLRGAYNPTFAGLTAKNILGWRDKHDLEHAGPNGGPMKVLTLTPEEAEL